LDRARACATESAREILSEAALIGKAASLNLEIELADETGHKILVIPVGHASGTETQG
jgi:hypothetical protein